MNSDDIRLAIVVGWAVSALAGAHIGGHKQAGWGGFLLGAFFGPLGVIAAGFLDGRPVCANCGGRHNGTQERPFPVCQYCGHAMPKRVEPTDGSWKSSLDEAARKLESAGLVRPLLQDE